MITSWLEKNAKVAVSLPFRGSEGLLCTEVCGGPGRERCDVKRFEIDHLNEEVGLHCQSVNSSFLFIVTIVPFVLLILQILVELSRRVGVL